MNHDEHLNDSALTGKLRDSLSELAAPARPPLDAITTRGRAYRQRRLAGIGAAGVAGSAVLALGLTGILGTAPTRDTGKAGTAASASRTGTIRTAAFTLDRNVDGTDTLILNSGQFFDPVALQKALVQHGIPALIEADTFCSSSPAPGLGPLHPGEPGVVNDVAQSWAGQSGPSPKNQRFLIDPGALRPGTELFFEYHGNRVFALNVIYTRSHTCSYGPPPSPAATPTTSA